MSTLTDGHTEVQLQVIWNRLLAIVEEAAQTLMRTAFSSTVREAGDLCAGLFDPQGRMVAQAVTGTPGHVNTMAEAVKHLLARFPTQQMAEGDQYITNDPWLASGHLHDLTVVAPVFRNGRAVALFGCCCHQVDIGGLGQGPDGRSIYEEGLQIPPMKLMKTGHLNEDLLSIVCENVRTPLEVRGDILSYITANESAARRLVAMLDEFNLQDLGTVSETIICRSRHVVGLMLPDLIFGCLDQALPDRVPAEGASCNWTVQLRRGPDQAIAGAPTFDTVFFNTGGSGARSRLDGLSATAFPSGVKAMPVEVVEYGAPIVVWRKELLADSGGAGQCRGGLGLKIEIGARHSAPFSLLAMFERMEHAAQGRGGGRAGARGRVYLLSGQELRGKGLQSIPPNSRLILETPGGGGYGEPRQRAPEQLRQDISFELVTREAAAVDYR